MRAIVCQSDVEDAAGVTAELVAQATEQLGGDTPRGALLFASTEYDHSVILAAVQERWPGLPLIGGTSDGEVSSAGGFRHDSAVLTLLVGDGFTVRTAVGRDLSKDIGAAVAAVASAIGRQPRVCFTVFAPSTNSSEVVRRLQERLGAPCPIVGGLTGDHAEYGCMVEFFGGEVLRDSLPIMVIEGNVGVGFGIGTGWFPIGEPRRVTQVDGHIVHTIEGRPAIEVYRDHWGSVPDGKGLGEYPLAVYPDGPDGTCYLRAVLGSDAATGSIQLAGECPKGSWIRMTEVLPEGILAGSEEAARSAAGAYSGSSPKLALVFSCAARKWVLGTKAEEELGLLREAFRRTGIEPALAGLYVFGEIAPTSLGAPSDFHNETCVAVLIGE